MLLVTRRVTESPPRTAGWARLRSHKLCFTPSIHGQNNRVQSQHKITNNSPLKSTGTSNTLKQFLIHSDSLHQLLIQCRLSRVVSYIRDRITYSHITTHLRNFSIVFLNILAILELLILIHESLRNLMLHLINPRRLVLKSKLHQTKPKYIPKYPYSSLFI